jgi:hypothetical protein
MWSNYQVMGKGHPNLVLKNSPEESFLVITILEGYSIDKLLSISISSLTTWLQLNATN